MFKLFACIALGVTSILLGDCACKRVPYYQTTYQGEYNRPMGDQWGNYRQYNRPMGNRWEDPNYYNNQPDYARELSPYYHERGYWSTATEMVVPL